MGIKVPNEAIIIFGDESVYHPDLEGICQRLEADRWQLPCDGDRLSDTYRSLWNVATQPDNALLADLSNKERIGMRNGWEGFSLPERRRAKLIRRLGILEYVGESINAALQEPVCRDSEITLKEVYDGVLTDIMDEYDISPDDVKQRVRNLIQEPRLRPWFLLPR